MSNEKGWIAGRALNNTAAWLEVKQVIKNKKIPIQDFAQEAIRTGELNIFHPKVYRKHTRHIVFNNKRYVSQQQLIDEFRTKKNCNYKGESEYREVCREMVKEYEKLKIVRQPENWELPNVIINPINIMMTKPGKYSLICHTLINTHYASPAIELMDITERGHVLKTMDSFRTEDMSSAYHQFAISVESSYACGFRFEGKVYIFQTMFYGSSSAVYLVNYLTNLACKAASIKFDKFIEAYIDDVFSESKDEDFRIYMENLGLQFSKKKSQAGPIIEYCGVSVDAIEKTFQVTEKSHTKMVKLWENATMRKSESEGEQKFLLFDDFQKLCGSVIRMAKTSIHGLLKSHFLLARLAESTESNHVLVELGEREQKEMSFWLSERHKISMEQFLPAAGSFKLMAGDPKRRKLVNGNYENSSDSSSKYWGIKFVVNGVTRAKSGKIPDIWLPRGIACQEGYSFREWVKIAKPKTRSSCALDSQVLQLCFSKRRSKNEHLNEILTDIYDLMEEKELYIDTYWVNTSDMKSFGSDNISRRVFSEFEENLNGLTALGSDGIINEYGKPKIDVFGSPSNIFDIMYCCNIEIRNDEKNMKQSGLEFLAENKFIPGILWLYPRNEVVKQTLSIISSWDWSAFKQLKILLLVRERFVEAVWSSVRQLKCVKEVKLETFVKSGRKSSKLKYKSQDTMVLFEIESNK